MKLSDAIYRGMVQLILRIEKAIWLLEGEGGLKLKFYVSQANFDLERECEDRQ